MDEANSSLSEKESIALSNSFWSETSLHLAALTGQYELAKILLSQGADARQKNSSGYDSLKYAAIGGFTEMLQLLLQHDVNGECSYERHEVLGSDGNTALHLATANGHLKAAELLLKNSSDASKLVHTKNSSGLSPIHIAAREGHLDLLELMMGVKDESKDPESLASAERDNQPPTPTSPVIPGSSLSSHDPRYPTGSIRRGSKIIFPGRSQTSLATPPFTTSSDHHKSPLEWAAEYGHKHIVDFILARSNDIEQEKAYSLNLAAQNGYTNVVEVLLEKSLTKYAIDARQNTALHLASKGGHLETVTELLKRGLFEIDSIETREMTPLHLAARAGHQKIVDILLLNKANVDLPNKKSKTALHLAAENGHLPCIETLLQPKYKANSKLVDKMERTALHFAAKNGQLKVVKKLCESTDIIWMEDKEHFTAFDYVVERSKNDVKEVEEFIRILKDTTDDGTFVRGGTPLHVVAKHKNMDVLRLLLKNEWKCDVKNSEGATPLHSAVRQKFDEGVKELLQDPDCNINAQAHDGATVMHYIETPELMNRLLKAGAKIDIKNNFEQTALFVAVYQRRFDLVQALLDSIPKPDVHTKDSNDWNLLHAVYDSCSIIELLLKPEHHVNPNSLSSTGHTPLALAIAWDYFESADLLLDADADPNLATQFQSSPLYSALESSNPLQFIQLLTDNKKPVNILAKDAEGITALHIAAQKDMYPEFEYLVGKLGNIKNTEIADIYASVLCECVSRIPFNSRMAMTEILVHQGLDVNRTTEPYFTALHEACSKGSIDAVKWLLEKNASVNVSDGKHGTPLCVTVGSKIDSEEKVRLLLDKRADINFFEKSQPTALQEAICQSKTHLIILLIDKGANVNLTGGSLDTPLNAAILGGVDITIIETILRNGADTSNPGTGGQLPVHAAAQNGRGDVLESMIPFGADPLSKDSGGRSALMHGVVNHNLNVVDFLLRSKKFDAEEEDAKRQTPLIVATVLGNISIVTSLLESDEMSNEILNAKDYYGKTALVHATLADDFEIVEKLLAKRADPRIVDCRGRGPLYWAARTARMKTLDIIITDLEKYEDHSIEPWNVAIHGAVASNKQQALVRLLEKEDVDAEYSGPDGWTALYTARRYESDRMEDTLQELVSATSRITLGLKKPSCWHSNDKFPGLKLGSDKTTLSTIGGTQFENLEHNERASYGAARTDYPMLPLFNDKVFYFEIKITKAAEGCVVIGFCDDKAPLHRLPGWDAGSWGFDSDNGRVYEETKGSWVGVEYSTSYGEGEVIGCGVNFVENCAFYTRGGNVIGRAFGNIRGKLYPTVAMDTAQEGWEITTVFPDEDGKSAEFIFRGDYDSIQTLEPPDIKKKEPQNVEKEDSQSDDDYDSEIVDED